MLRTEQRGSVLHVTIDRPEVRNAFNDELIAKLTDVFASLPDPRYSAPNPHFDIRAVVLSGEGKAFCAGGDLEWMRNAADYTEEQNVADALKLAKLFDLIVRCPAVVIAKVHGAAFGGGCGMVAAADVAIAEENTKFSFSEVKLGLLPATISTFVIPKIGPGNARSLFATGEVFLADKALRIGLVHEAVPEAELDAAVDEKLKAVLSAGPRAVAESKQIVLDSPISIEESARRLAAARAGAEGKEGVAAFLEKRKASWVEQL